MIFNMASKCPRTSAVQRISTKISDQRQFDYKPLKQKIGNHCTNNFSERFSTFKQPQAKHLNGIGVPTRKAHWPPQESKPGAKQEEGGLWGVGGFHDAQKMKTFLLPWALKRSQLISKFLGNSTGWNGRDCIWTIKKGYRDLLTSW